MKRRDPEGLPRNARWCHDFDNPVQADREAPTCYERLTHERMLSNEPTYLEVYEWGVGVRTLTKGEYDAATQGS
jgi:hypothetical protein